MPWAMDFVHDSVAVDTSISSKAVTDVLNRLIAIKGRPDTIVVVYIQPGKPIENGSTVKNRIMAYGI